MCTSPVSDFGQLSISSRCQSEVDTFSHKSGSPSAATSQLIRASVENDLSQVVSLLVDCGAQVNQKVRGTTALHESAKAGHISIVQELIVRKAEVNTVNRSGCTALHFATLCKDKAKAVDILQHLIESSSQVNSTSERMDTPLHFAAYCQPSQGAEEVVRYLLSKRAMVNARNRNAESPLINAALNNNADAAKVLVEYNADIGHRTSKDQTAQDIAMERGCQEVVQVLEKMKDPLAQLTDTTALMRTALSQMQTVDMLSGQLRQQTLLTDAYESVAAAAVAELEVSARARLASQALSAFTIHSSARTDVSSLAPAQVPLSQQQLVQALITLLLISRTASGSALLHKAGVLEVMPNVEEQVRAHNNGHKELRELKASLNKTQVELLELSAERSCSSTPSSITDQWLLNTQSIGPSTPSTTHTTMRNSAARGTETEEVGSEGTIQCSETPSESLGDSAELGKGSRKRMPSWSRNVSKSGRPAGNSSRAAETPKRASSQSPRKNLPLIADDIFSDDDNKVPKQISGDSAEVAALGASFDSVYEAQDQTCLPGTASQASSTCSDNRASPSRAPSWVKRWVDIGEGFSSNKTGSPQRDSSGQPHVLPELPTEKDFDTIPQEDAEDPESRENRTGADLIQKYREQARRRSRMCVLS